MTQTSATLPPRRRRHDGWSRDAQRAFIAALVETGCAGDAAERVGKSLSSAYALRRDPRAAPFALAWERAIACRRTFWLREAERRAIQGEDVAVFSKGRFIGNRTRYSDRLLAFLITRADRELKSLPALTGELSGGEDAAFDVALEMLEDLDTPSQTAQQSSKVESPAAETAATLCKA